MSIDLSWQRVTLLASVIFGIWSGFSSWGEARELVDQSGHIVTLVERPLRIVTVAPSLAEVAGDLLVDELDRIVGVSEHTTFPPALTNRPSIGPFFKLNLERILSLKPDLVLATKDGNSREEVRHLRELKLPVVVVSTSNLGEVSRSMELIGEALGVPDRGKRMSAQFNAGLESLRKRAAARKIALHILIQIGMDPLVVAGGNSFVSDAVSVLGVKNIYQAAEQPYPRPSLEDAVIKSPDVILIVAMSSNVHELQHSEGKKWRSFQRIKAVKDNRIYVLPGDRILRPSLGLLEGLALVERTLFP